MKVIGTVGATELRDKLAPVLRSVEGDGVVQILHRGEPIRLIITQEHYLKLLALAQSYARSEFQNEGTVRHQSPEEVLAAVGRTLDSKGIP